MLDGLRERMPALVACFADAKPVAAQDSDVVIAFPEGQALRRRKAEEPAARSVARCAPFKALTGVVPRLSFETRELAVAVAEPLDEAEWSSASSRNSTLS